MGALSILSSDSQAMGRVGEVITRTWQTAHKMKAQRGVLNGDREDSDNLRVRRYVAEYTLTPAIEQGMRREIGVLEAGKLSDRGPRDPAFLATKTETAGWRASVCKVL